MIRCPHCDAPGIPGWRKAVMSPGMPATCKSCGQPADITYPAWLSAMLPGSALMLASLWADSTQLEWGLNISGLLLMIIIPYLFVPLQKS